MSKRVFFWGLFFVLIIIGALMWLGRVKFEIKNQLGIKLNVSQISGNIFLLKSGYWKKDKKILISPVL
jgi:small neutral amino acid transporter SnatA (MarC family)